VCFASGMAAISTSLFTFLQKGSHAIFSKHVYGGTFLVVSEQFHKLGIEVSWVQSSNISDFEKEIKQNTKVLYVESPSNPLLSVVDLREIAQLAKKHNIVTMIDNTFATPINQNPIDYGIDIVIHSATKYLNGHSDLVMGVVVSSVEFIQKITHTGKIYGGSPSPMDCCMLERGLKTLALRVRQQNLNAMELALFLQKQPAVKKVYYPGLSTHENHAVAKKQMRGFGGMVSFELCCEHAEVEKFTKNLELVQLAASLGGVETTLCFPAVTSHVELSKEEREKLGISDTLTRVTVGIEDIADIIADFERALAHVGLTLASQ